MLILAHPTKLFQFFGFCYNTYMEIIKNISLAELTTMKVGGRAAFCTAVKSDQEIYDALDFAKAENIPVYIIGGGSNSIARDETYPGLIVKNLIKGFEIISDDETSTTITVGAGEIWDSFVQKTTDLGLSGVEAISAVPGSVGASPVQNVGAYGQEVSDTITELKAIDTESGETVVLKNQDCEFSYRNSIFRDKFRGRYIITAVTFKLSKTHLKPPFYPALNKYIDQHQITDFSPASIRKIVTAIRQTKLPDPSLVPNSGSFFKNALVDQNTLQELQKTYPDIPNYQMPGNQWKIPTGWLIDQANLKGKTFSGIQIYDKNALVLVNRSTKEYRDLAAARTEIQNQVFDQFGIKIEQEPLEIVENSHEL